MGKILTVGSLFSGIGGFDLGLERAGMKIQWQVENNDFCRRILQKHWPTVPCHYDITTIDWHWIPRVDLICGGFPCQPFSVAGKRRGQADNRYLWPEVVRCLDVLRPAWFLGENVPGLLHLGIDTVLADLEAIDYQVTLLGIPACGVGAPHIRRRVWIVAHNDSRGCAGPDLSIRSRQPYQTAIVSSRESDDVANATGHDAGYGDNGNESIQRNPSPNWRNGSAVQSGARWPTEPSVGRVAYGVPYRVDRLRGLGNAVVPQIAEALGRMILEVENYGPGS